MQNDQTTDLHEDPGGNQTEQSVQEDFYLLAIAELRSMMTNEMTAMASPASGADGSHVAEDLQGNGAQLLAMAEQGGDASQFQLGGLAHDMFDNTVQNSNTDGDGEGQQIFANLLTGSGDHASGDIQIFVAPAGDHHPIDSALLHDALPEITGSGLQDTMNLTSLLEDAHRANQGEADWRHDSEDGFGYTSAFNSFLSSGTSFEDHGSYGGMEFAKPTNPGGGGGGGHSGGGGGGGHSGGGGGNNWTPLADYTSGGAGDYNIHLTFDGDWSSNSNYQYLQEAFVYGADLLSYVITGHLDPNYSDPGVDLSITVSLQYIDGRGNPLTGNILGWAEHSPGADGPYYYSSTATIAFDSYDVDQDLSNLPKNWDTTDFTWDDVAVHEMIHAVGFSSDTFMLLGLIDDPNSSTPHFTGTNAINDYGALVPLEAGGGSGTALSHWDEATFSDEIMTGYVGTNPTMLSSLTVAAFQDLGYTVADANFSTVIDMNQPIA